MPAGSRRFVRPGSAPIRQMVWSVIWPRGRHRSESRRSFPYSVVHLVTDVVTLDDFRLALEMIWQSDPLSMVVIGQQNSVHCPFDGRLGLLGSCRYPSDLSASIWQEMLLAPYYTLVIHFDRDVVASEWVSSANLNTMPLTNNVINFVLYDPDTSLPRTSVQERWKQYASLRGDGIGHGRSGGGKGAFASSGLCPRRSLSEAGSYQRSKHK